MSKPRPSALGAILRFFRFANGLSEAEAADLFGMRPALLSQLERGEEGTLSRARLEELLARLDVPPDAIDHALYSLGVAVPPEPSASPVEPSPAQRRIIRRAAVGAGQGALESTEEKLTENVRRMMSSQARAEAATSWETLRDLPPRRRRLAVETENRYWSWALAERFCEESVRAAAHRASEAVELSRLGLRAAELAPETDPWRSRLLGWVWAFMANARRVQGDLPAAEEGFQRSDRLLDAGGAANSGLLDGTRPLDLKASLRRYQGRYDEALALLEEALNGNSAPEARGRILINKANTLELMGDSARAILELRQAEILLNKGSRDARLVFAVKHSLAYSLWQLGQFREAEVRLPETRKGAIETGNELDLVRVLWVEGGVAAGLGKKDQALAAWEQARRYFNTHRIGYDAALASLELAVLYLEDGRVMEVKRLSEEMFWIFKAQGVHREALVALRLFYEAVRKDEATTGLAQGVVEYLKKARYHSELRFEP